ncbi:DUF3987 domain-containing protein [Frankia sp. Cas3]|uniref:DUF3987 domain-containing protein n=1 Tax=Frankia sp. Cas3 TaxID=3073926 RepID=UPI002AD4CFEC|nr:DUF3987 domain-containing protein [Frankia sp. Cas3]
MRLRPPLAYFGGKTTIAEQIETQLRPGGQFHDIREWANKPHGTTLRIAGLLHLAHRPHDGWHHPIAADQMADADALADVLAARYTAAMTSVTADPAAKPQSPPRRAPPADDKDPQPRSRTGSWRTPPSRSAKTPLPLIAFTEGALTSCPHPPPPPTRSRLRGHGETRAPLEQPRHVP